jgi:hypothetical protein
LASVYGVARGQFGTFSVRAVGSNAKQFLAFRFSSPSVFLTFFCVRFESSE